MNASTRQIRGPARSWGSATIPYHRGGQGCDCRQNSVQPLRALKRAGGGAPMAPDLLNFQLANFPSEENLACRHLGVDQHCLCRLVERRAGGEEMRAARLKELEEMEE